MQKSKSAESDDDEIFFATLEWKKEWQRSLPRLSDRELLEAFPVSRETLYEKLTEWRQEYNNLKNEIVHKLSTLPEKDREIYEIFIEKFWIPKLLTIENHLFRLKRLLAIIDHPDKGNRQWENIGELIQIARTRPIYEFARDKLDLKPSGRNFVALCPFHDERTPSFHLYTESNRFYCFGCHEKGDAITLTMRLCGVDFKEAVRMLQ